MQKTYKVIIKETSSQEFLITAQSEDDAVLTAIEQYEDEELALAPGKVLYKMISTLDVRNEAEFWLSF